MGQWNEVKIFNFQEGYLLNYYILNIGIQCFFCVKSHLNFLRAANLKKLWRVLLFVEFEGLKRSSKKCGHRNRWLPCISCVDLEVRHNNVKESCALLNKESTRSLLNLFGDASADLEVQLVQLNHCDEEYSNYWNTLLRNLKLSPYINFYV